MTLTRPSKISSDGKHAARVSMWLLWWAPLSVLIGFLAANRFLAESWPL